MKIYLIAGPPGIGKSTHSKTLVPTNTQIIDQDLAAYQYKQQGFENYKDIASLSTNAKIRELIFSKEDFALELNLGFPSHYSFLRSILAVCPEAEVQLILFYTDDINICQDRARIRFISGGHEVTPETINEMYRATFPLYFENKTLFTDIRLINVSYDDFDELNADSIYPNWVLRNNLQTYLQ